DRSEDVQIFDYDRLLLDANYNNAADEGFREENISNNDGLGIDEELNYDENQDMISKAIYRSTDLIILFKQQARMEHAEIEIEINVYNSMQANKQTTEIAMQVSNETYKIGIQ
ncbi:15294_t:CDS:2, partial [Dentiscutata heterogama]